MPRTTPPSRRARRTRHAAHAVLSLASVAGGTKGLGLREIIASLCTPGRDISTLKDEVLNRLVTRTWYLHTGRDGRLFDFQASGTVVAGESCTRPRRIFVCQQSNPFIRRIVLRTREYQVWVASSSH